MKDNYPKNSWISSKIKIKNSKINGKGMFATKVIKSGEIITIWGADYVTKSEATNIKNKGKLIMHLDTNLYSIEERGDDITYFINHSCDPNIWMRNVFTLEARKNIKIGEELTADYAMWEGDKYVSSWNCNCKSKLCRKTITGKDWKLKDLQKRYKNHFSPLLNKRIKNQHKF